ncbi:sensor histidine kinase [Sphingomonas nostoxanthinifaciens]|uniref:sensor histidine kinase n=1 Tax=Sphingomonas nostoxanthinifaciens TaxID=2872652 RepID=UPI001CC211E9|nr:ATP-binding protein [Sphingomonas nostoxanthinifaciens]UAK23720.1 hypothetical protein K8P63_15225 [Sphingomonas nostoxanthinifaciens]
MLKRRPLRLRGRIGVILLVHTALMNLVLFGFATWIDGSHLTPLYRLPVPEKVALIATAFEHTPPDTHADLSRAFSDQIWTVRLERTLPPERAGIATPDTIARYRDVLGGRPFRIETTARRAPVSLDARPLFSPELVRVAVALPGGGAVAIAQTANMPLTKILDHRLLFLLAILVIDIAVVLWLAAQTTRPVERLARAARDDRLDTLRAGGPREIVELTESFVQLRTRLRDLLHERTRMLAAIAHDYRTYLTRLELRGEFIEDEAQRALAAQDLAEMRALLDDTLTFARESVDDSAGDATCDMRIELARIADERRERGENLQVPRQSGPLLVRASALSFQRMMANLIDNAMRYGGGRAIVRVQAGPTIVHVFVEDEGPGVPEESLARLVEPFERLETSRARHTGGVGLGLSIVQALAKRYGGTLALENRNGGGFRAILTLRAA